MNEILKYKIPRKAWLAMLLPLFLLFSCKHTGEKTDGEEAKTNPVVQVKITHPEMGSISDYIELNATTTFLRKELVKSIANGYITGVNITIGEMVHKGQVLFSMQTKESRALDPHADSNAHSPAFGMIQIKASRDGIISGINHQKGDYVQDAEQLATISEQNSLVFLIDAPYEYHAYLQKGKGVTIMMPDGQKITGTIKSDLPTMDVTNQTQNYVIQPSACLNIPEGLVARVKILKVDRPRTITLPKAAVLANEKEDNFWVMKLINDSTAVKVPVKTGLQDDEKEEILSPRFSMDDRILVSGNYGLSDTAKVKITP